MLQVNALGRLAGGLACVDITDGRDHARLVYIQKFVFSFVFNMLTKYLPFIVDVEINRQRITLQVSQPLSILVVPQRLSIITRAHRMADP